MYKVFINNKAVLLTNNSNKIFLDTNKKIIHYKGKEALHSDIEKIESGEIEEKFIIFLNNELDSLKKDFFSLYKKIKAAGGIVRNKPGDILFIYRLGKWDLPKGKAEEKEKIKNTAIREVKEETGLKKLKIIKELTPTYHTYIRNGERILKKTYWFEMFAPGDQELTPQYKESITEVRWFKESNIKKVLKSTYRSIKEVISDYLS